MEPIWPVKAEDKQYDAVFLGSCGRFDLWEITHNATFKPAQNSQGYIRIEDGPYRRVACLQWNDFSDMVWPAAYIQAARIEVGVTDKEFEEVKHFLTLFAPHLVEGK